MTYSNTREAPSLTFDDYLGVLPSDNKIIKQQKDYPCVVTNCPVHDDRNPSLLMSWIDSYKFKSEKICAFQCYAGCERKDLVAYFNKRLSHKLNAIQKFWDDRKKEKRERQNKRKSAEQYWNDWQTERGL